MNAIAITRPVLAVVPAADRSPVAVYLASLGSARSRESMRSALDTVARILCGAEADACPWHELRVEHVAALRSKLAERYAPSSANVRLCAVRGVLKACRRLGMISRAVEADLAEVEPVRGERVQAGRFIEADDLRRLFVACGKDNVGKRDAAALALLAGYGLRREEAAHLDLSGFNRGTGDLLVMGKGGKQRAIECGAAGAREIIEAWIAVRGDAPGPLLCPVNKGGRVELRRASAQAIYLRLRVLSEASGVEVAPHDFRRTLISNLLDVADIATVQAVAGHASPVTTSRYDRRGSRARRSAMARISLIGGAS